MRGAILAGGAASRFGGKPKGLEHVGGERILDRVTRSMQAALGELPLLIANAEDAGTWLEGLTVVQDVIPDCGTMSGLYTAVTQHESPVFIMAWDMPFITTELIETVAGGANGYDVFLPASTGPQEMEPLCGVYRPACAKAIRKSMEDEDYRATGFHELVNAGTLPIAEVEKFGKPDTLFFNVNSPMDLKRAEELWRSLHE